jgi:DNA-binding transcriptional ArsR family regulator
MSCYSRTVGFDMLRDGKVEANLHSAYDRFGLQSYKVAMLLAAMDARELPVVVSLAHATRAIQIVETWRESLHRLWANELEVEVVALGGRILDRLAKAPTGHTKRELCQYLHETARNIGEALELLENSGAVEQLPRGRQVLWRALSVATVANCSTIDATVSPHPDAA